MSPVKTSEIVEKVNDIVNKWDRSSSFLIEMLQDVQEEYKYLPKESFLEIGKILKIPLSRIYTIATFYSSFSLKPKGEYQINVCLGTACHVKGAKLILDAIQRELDIEVGDTTKDMKFGLETVRCIGCCGLAPVITINEDLYGKVTIVRVPKILEKYKTKGE
jgi:NADH:ubiquinone oxidoreductase subunit E